MTIDVSNGRRFSDEPTATEITEDSAIVLIRTSTGVKAVTVATLQSYLTGAISSLETEDKTSLVAAINELVSDKEADETYIDTLQEIISNYKNAGVHNAIYRGKYLGDSLTDDQSAAIQAGTFEDLYVGDYWTINGVNYRIAAFDYYYQTGDTACTTHHIVVVPDTALYSAQMNSTNITTGAYVGSEMYTANLETAKTTIKNAFGSDHILTHRQYLKNAVTSGYESGGAWYDSEVELMTEQNVYGGKVFANVMCGTSVPQAHTIDKSQFPLFKHRPDLISIRSAHVWLRDVVSASAFAVVSLDGNCAYAGASYSDGVRPAFSVI